MATRTERRAFFALRVAIGVILVVLLARSGTLDWSRVRRLGDPATAGVALALLATALVLVSWRLCLLLRRLGLRLPLTNSVRLTLIGMLFNACLPGGASGELVRIYYATAENRGRGTEIATIMGLDRGIGLLALLAWPALCAPLFPTLVRSSGAITLLVLLPALAAAGLGLLLLAMMSARVTGGRWARRLIATRRLGPHVGRMVEALRVYRRSPGTLLAAVGVALLGHTAFVLALLALAAAVAPGGMDPAMALLLPLGFMANALPVTPGGLGVGEAALEGVFRLGGFTGGAELMIAWRVLSLVLALGGLPVYLRGRRRLVLAGAEPAASVPGTRETLSRQGASG